METMRAQDRNGLAAIHRRLHDVHLALPESLPTAGPSTVRMAGLDERFTLVPLRSWGPFVSFERRKALVTLAVENVIAAELIDHAETGQLPFARIRFDEARRLLSIYGHTPVELHLQVERLDVRAEIDDMVPSGRTWRLRMKSA